MNSVCRDHKSHLEMFHNELKSVETLQIRAHKLYKSRKGRAQDSASKFREEMEQVSHEV